MSDITFSNVFTDGSIPSGQEVSENFYEPTGGPNSFETVNGGLDQNNRIAYQDIVRRDVQRGTFSGGRMVGRTINLDYYSRFFEGFNGGATYDGFVPIPGCSQTFYLKYVTPIVIFSWSVMVAHDGATAGTPQTALLQFFVDGSRVSHSVRTCPASFGAIGGVPWRWGKERDRVFSGHHTVPSMAAGWHNVSLRIASTAIHTRVRCGSMRYIYFQ